MGVNLSTARAHAPEGSKGDAGKCPVNHETRSAFLEAAKKEKEADAQPRAAADAAANKASPPPAAAAAPQGEREVYNVYSQRINPDNMMPMQPNQLPVAGQDAPLPQSRVQSSIPKGGTEGVWAYPSPQQFYNSLVRKDKKGDDITAKDVELIVAIHNNMNEHGWREVQRWESLHCDTCDEPKLLKFKGRPHDLSPMARFRMLLGFGKPFDRHDWIVDRCGVRQRYVLDYYHVNDPAQLAKFGLKAAPGNETQLVIDVRPALDSFGAFMDRARVAVGSALGLTPGSLRIGGFSVPPDVKTSHATHKLERKEPHARLAVKDEHEFRNLSSLSVPKLRDLSRRFESDCSTQLDAVKAATDERSALQANAAFRTCMGSIVCPSQAERFRRMLEDKSVDAAQVDAAYNDMDACVERFAMAAAQTMANEQLAATKEAAKECSSETAE